MTKTSAPPLGMSLERLAELSGATLIGDGDTLVRGVALPADARPHDVTFCAHPLHFRDVAATSAAALVCDIDTAASHADTLPCGVLCGDNAALIYQKVVAALYPRVQDPHHFITARVHPTAVIDAGATLGTGVHVGAYAVIGRSRIGDRVHIAPHVVVGAGVVLEDDVVLAPRVVLERGVVVGARTRIQAGVVVGSDGFGYAPDGPRNVKVAQVGTVHIGPDVEIGANSAIDRGQVRDTRIGAGTKIDNLVQVGHGVHIGENAVIIAQTGLAGDVTVGAAAVLAGQVGVVPYTTVGAGARVGAKSGVAHDVAPGAAVSGIPAYPHGDWLRTSALNRRMGRLFKRVAALERDRS